jgi:hypothetical protein
MTDKLSTAIEQSVDKTVKNLDKMAISQANVSENDLDETIDSLNKMSGGGAVHPVRLLSGRHSD